MIIEEDGILYQSAIHYKDALMDGSHTLAVAKKLEILMCNNTDTAKTTDIGNILQQAEAIIYGEREQTYGKPSKNLDLIAQYWTSHLTAKYQLKITLTAEDVCGMMILLKQARLANTPSHIDSLVDIAGYAALQERILKDR